MADSNAGWLLGLDAVSSDPAVISSAFRVVALPAASRTAFRAAPAISASNEVFRTFLYRGHSILILSPNLTLPGY